MRVAHRRRAGLLGRLFRDQRAIAAVEFALLLPLAIAFYAVIFETGRGVVAMRKFNSTVENVARLAARHPEFEQRVRNAVPLIVPEMAAPLSTKELDLTLFSVKIVSGAPTLVFAAYNFYGNNSSANWNALVQGGVFAEGEAAIVVAGRYSYTPLFLAGLVPKITFTHATVVAPFFSRSYNYQSGNSDWSYFNVK